MKFLKFLLPLLLVFSLTACSSNVQSSASQPPSVAPTANVRVIQVTSENWKFAPTVITVKKGEKVQLQVTGISGIHGFAVPGLNINQPVEPGQTVTIELPTNVAGTYAFFCSIPCGPGHANMTGQIVIES